MLPFEGTVGSCFVSISRLAVRDNTTFKLGLSFHLDHVGKLRYKKAGHSGNSGSKPKCSDPERRVMENDGGGGNITRGLKLLSLFLLLLLFAIATNITRGLKRVRVQGVQ